ncbi:Bromodomain-containing protein, partial [Mrakia frigida]|uniref:Bromodomain-containing protein n=1 Tax=Mrakia frigida TaxID=29902 RepID=UPI003FCC00BC
EAFAFLAPVDPIALGIPHYFQIVQHPMDLTTVEYKLAASGPKPKGRADKGKYADKNEVARDFERVWNNSVKFNGPDHLVSLAGLKLEEAFDKAMRGCPPDEVVS